MWLFEVQRLDVCLSGARGKVCRDFLFPDQISLCPKCTVWWFWYYQCLNFTPIVRNRTLLSEKLEQDPSLFLDLKMIMPLSVQVWLVEGSWCPFTMMSWMTSWMPSCSQYGMPVHGQHQESDSSFLCFIYGSFHEMKATLQRIHM